MKLINSTSFLHTNNVGQYSLTYTFTNKIAGALQITALTECDVLVVGLESAP